MMLTSCVEAADTRTGRLLGIDAGGSRTKVVLLEAGQVTGLPDRPPMNSLLTENLTERLHAIIRAAAPTAAGIGIPGLRSLSQGHQLGAALTRLTGCEVRVTSDSQVARLGAFRDAPGIVVIAGTGSSALGFDGQRWERAGGHGFLLGDEGGAYWIGCAAVRAALRWEDGRGGSELIHQTVTQATGCSLDALIRAVHSSPSERNRLAVLAPVITELAAADTEALRITEEAARHLAALAQAVQRRLGPLPVAGVGGVFEAPLIWDRFTELTGATRPLAPPAVGAAMLAGSPVDANLPVTQEHDRGLRHRPPGPDRQPGHLGRQERPHPRRRSSRRPRPGDAGQLGGRLGRHDTSIQPPDNHRHRL
jgi:N-acetylglucosamine kinase-like BadF-type ATPase